MYVKSVEVMLSEMFTIVYWKKYLCT